MLRNFLGSLLLAFAVVMAGCGGGGGGGSDSADQNQTTAPPAPTGSFSGGTSQFKPGSVVSLDVANFPLTSSLSGDVGGTSIEPRVIDGRVVFVMPTSIPAGSRQLNLSNGSQTLQIPLTVVALTLPSPPAQYLDDVNDQLEAVLASRKASATGDELAFLNWASAQLAAQRTFTQTADAATLEKMATIVMANGLADTIANEIVSYGQHKFDLPACNELSNRYPNTFAKAILATGLLVAGIGNPPLFFIGAAVLAATVYQATEVVGQIVDKCLSPFGDVSLTSLGDATSIGGKFKTFSAATLSLPFNYNVARNFNVTVPSRMDAVIGADLTVMAHRLGGLIRYLRAASSQLASALPVSVENTLLGYRRELALPGDAGNYSIGTISDSRIEGFASGTGTTLTLRFRFKQGQMPSQAVSFNFTLVDVTTQQLAGTYTAQLNVAEVPVAQDGAIQVKLNVPFAGQLAAKFADSYVIVTQPQFGSVTLTNAETGQFSYLASSLHGTDFFEYRGVNAIGTSNLARVNVTVDLKSVYEAGVVGTWHVTNPTSDYMMTIDAGGLGHYTVNGTNYPIHWTIRSDANGYKLYDTDFWHPAYDNMDREALTLPVTQFTRADGTLFVKQ